MMRIARPALVSFAPRSRRFAAVVVSDDDHFDKLVKENPKVIINFGASWCGPCKAVAPEWKAIADNADYSGIAFLKVDVDDVPDAAQQYDVRSIPAFQVVQNGKKKGQLFGWNKKALEDELKTLKSM
ncbi:Thioredoxin [Diplonema papillatum]|nr:Thioredoxin [Diplonema papillatum]